MHFTESCSNHPALQFCGKHPGLVTCLAHTRLVVCVCPVTALELLPVTPALAQNGSRELVSSQAAPSWPPPEPYESRRPAPPGAAGLRGASTRIQRLWNSRARRRGSARTGTAQQGSVAERERGQEERGVRDKSGDPAWGTRVVVPPCHTCSPPTTRPAGVRLLGGAPLTLPSCL